MSEEWNEIQDRLVKGDPLAFAELGRLITSVLRQLRAYDFEDEWDDLRQDVSWAVIENAKRGRLRDTKAFVGYVRAITRNKFMDRLKRRLKVRENEELAWEAESADLPTASTSTGVGHDAESPWSEVAQLPTQERELVLGIYREGYTYEEMSSRSGVPLGTLKHRLRRALEKLRTSLVGESEILENLDAK